MAEPRYVTAQSFEPPPLEHLAVDLETTSLDSRTGKIVGLSFAIAPGRAVYVPVGHSRKSGGENANLFDVVKQLNDYEARHAPVWVFYNAKFDMAWLRQAGFIPTRWVDVQILLYNVWLHRALELRGLKAAAKALLGIEMLSLKALFKANDKTLGDAMFADLPALKALFKANDKTLGDSTFADLPVDSLTLAYACADADITLRLYQLAMRALEGAPVPRNLQFDHELVGAIAQMEATGILVDSPACEALYQSLEKSIYDSAAEVRKLANDPELNPASPAQVGQLLYAKFGMPIFKQTDKGAPSTDTATLKKLFRKYGKTAPVIRHLLELRETHSRIMFVEKLRHGSSPTTGRVHPQYHQCRQVTGRLSSTGDGQHLKRFNFQGVPKLPADHPHNIRKVFKASPGYVWVSIDLANVELRLIANFSRDPALIRAFNNNEDLHANTCQELFGKRPTDPDWEKWRKIAKICNFNLAYAFGTTALQAKIETETGSHMSQKDCEALFEAFFERAYPGWGQYKKDLVAQSRRTMRSTTLFGRERDLSPYYRGNTFYGCAGDRQAVNHPIQGSCADLLRRAIYTVQQGLFGRESVARLVSTVHDELNFEVVKSGVGAEAVTQLVRIIEWTPDGFAVPIKASVSVGPNWGELKEWKL